jgi:hypothetical protein
MPASACRLHVRATSFGEVSPKRARKRERDGGEVGSFRSQKSICALNFAKRASSTDCGLPHVVPYTLT